MADLRAKPREVRPLGTGDCTAGALRGLIEPLHNRTVDGEAGGRERSTARSRKQTILDKCQDLEFLTQLPSIAIVDRILRPLEQLGVPCRAVIQRVRRDSTDDVIGPVSIRQIRGQSLPLLICEALRPFGGND